MKKKALLLTILSSMAIATTGFVVALSAGKLGFIDSKATEKVISSILFSRETGNFSLLDDNMSSIYGVSATGATYYAVSRNITQISSPYIAQFGFGKPYDEQYISFSTTVDGTDDFEFEKITGIKIKSPSNLSFTVYYGSGFNNSYTVSASSEPEKHTFATPLTQLRVGVGTTATRSIISVELFYECGGDEPTPSKEVDHLSFSSMKSNYVLGESFEEPTVVAWYTDNTHEEVEASFSVVDMTKLGKQTVTASYEGVDKNFTIEIWPSATAQRVSFKGYSLIDYEEHETSEFLTGDSVLPQYGEPGETVTFTPVFKAAFMYNDCYDETGEIAFAFDGTNVTFTMPSSAVEIHIVYQSNPYKTVTFTGVNVDTFNYVDASTVISSVLPAKAIPGNAVEFQTVAKKGYAVLGVDGDEAGVEITENEGTYSFTMPSNAVVIYIYFQEVPELVSMYVKNPKTTYTVGSDFVIPTVMGVYSNESEAELTVSADNFSGFDSSAVATGQVITVSYEGVADVNYTVDIVEEGPTYLNCTYRIAQSSTTDYKLQFNEDNTGKYYRWYNSTESWAISFTYTYDSSTGAVSIELNHSVTYSQVNNFATGYRLVQANSTSGVISFVNDTGFINASNQFEIDMVKVSAGVFSTEHRTFTLA